MDFFRRCICREIIFTNPYCFPTISAGKECCQSGCCDPERKRPLVCENTMVGCGVESIIVDDFLLSLVHHTLVVYPLYPIPYPIFNRYFFNGYLPAFREDKRSFGNTGLTHVSLHLVGLGDRPLVHIGGELGVHVTSLTEGLHEVILPGEVGHQSRFDLAGVTSYNHVSVGRSQRLAQLTTPR
jgi:hypothetical protein